MTFALFTALNSIGILELQPAGFNRDRPIVQSEKDMKSQT